MNGEEDNLGHNPGHITPELCDAYRATIEAKISGLRNQIIGAIALSTMILSLIMLMING